MAEAKCKLATSQKQIHQKYRFTPNISVTPLRNAIRLYGSDSVQQLPIPTNLAFHDLTPTQCAPNAAKSLLGLGSKFIPTPNFTTCNKLIEKATDQFERDFFIKVIFSAEVTEEEAL